MSTLKLDFDIFEIGESLFGKDTKSNLSIDNHLVDNESVDESIDGNSESDDEDSMDNSNNEDEDKEERKAITSLEDARNVHDVTMLLLHKLISGLSDNKQHKKMSNALQKLEPLQGDTKIGGGQYEVDDVVKEFLTE